MYDSDENKAGLNFVKLVGLYLPLVIITVIIHNYLIDTPHLDRRIALHNLVTSGNAPAPVQYRILTYYLAELFIKCGLSFKLSYLFLRFLFTLSGALLLHLFLSKWLKTVICIIGVLFFFSAVPLTYLNYYMQPADMPNLSFFLIGYILIEKRKDSLFAVLLFISMLNRETPVLLPLIWLFYRYDELPIKALVTKFVLFIAISTGAYLMLRVIYTVKQYYSFSSYFWYNTKHINSYIYAFLFFGYPLIYLASVWKNTKIPKFLKRALLFVPFFVIVHWTMSIVAEVRLWLPIFPLVIACGLISIFGTDAGEPHFKDVTFFTKNKNLIYGILLVSFSAAVSVTNYYYEKIYLSKLSPVEISEFYIAEGCICLNQGNIEDAEERFLKAEKLNPANPHLNFLLGRFYYKVKPEREKSLRYLNSFVKSGTDSRQIYEAKKLIRLLQEK
ncbi:MAG: tetratricopeptide repeat protein [Elusimicrobia bacterium]|nr:tetratricopeptide repeat protein [Elusimicrobiota bacterium]